MGGVITRHVVNRRPELFAGVVYVGVPQRAINILGPMRNGDVVLLNEKILTARVHFSMRTSFSFLPDDGFAFVDRDSGEDLPVDFFNVDDVSTRCSSFCSCRDLRVGWTLTVSHNSG